MQLLKKYKSYLFIVLATITCFVIANQLKVANNGEFVSSVMYLRYTGYLLISLLIFKIGVKAKVFIVYNIAMIVLILIALEVVFYALLGSPTRENKSFEMPDIDSNNLVSRVGALPSPDTILNDMLVVESDTSFNVDYTIDKYRKRITPKVDSSENSEYALFFGCSIAFGYGLEDDETIPYQYQMNGDIKAYNFAFNGHATNHVAARFEAQDLSKQVDEKKGKAFYLFFWDHIARAVGTMRRHTSWLHFAPYYYKENDSLKRGKMFKNGRPITSYFYESIYQSSILEYLEVDLPFSLNESHFELVAEMVAYAKDRYEVQFGNDEFYLVIIPTYKEFESEDMKLFIKILEDKGVGVVDLKDMVDYNPEYTLKYDSHPNAKLGKLFSKELYNKIK
jgi:hypothetical protein